MNGKTDITLTFRTREEAAIARNVGNAMIGVWDYNGGELLYLDGDSRGAHRERHVDSEEEWIFKMLLQDYRNAYKEVRRNSRSEKHTVRNGIPRFRLDGTTIYLRDCYCLQGRFQIQCDYHRDFFSQLCFILTVSHPDRSFEGMVCCREGEAKLGTERTRAVYDGSTLRFERLEGMPVYYAHMVNWTRMDGKFIKSRKTLPTGE